MITISLSRRAERLRRTPWLDVIGAAWLVFVGGMFISFVLPRPLAHSLKPLLLAAPLLVLMAKDLSHLPDALRRTRDAVDARAWGQLVAAWLPPELLGLFRLDAALRRGFLHWLLRRASPQAPAGRPFGYLERGSYRTIVAIALFLSFVELPLDAAIMPLFIRDPAERKLIHMLMLVATVSNLVWLFGDRWLVGAGRHVLTKEGLQLRIGARTHGLVPIEDIAGCERIDEPVKDWLRRHGIDAGNAVKASPSPLDKPNVVLILKPDSRVRLSHLGRERTDLSCIFLYVDRPQELIACICML